MKLIVFLVVFSVSFSLACLNCRRRKTCETGWTQINRTLGPWCVKTVSSKSYWNYSIAEQACSELGAVLSSVESEAELEIEKSLVTGITVTYLGAKLRPECVCGTFSEWWDVCENTSNCTLYNAFVWTDNFTVGDSMMKELYNGAQNSFYMQYIFIVNTGIYCTSDIRVTSSAGSYVFGALCGKKAT